MLHKNMFMVNSCFSINVTWQGIKLELFRIMKMGIS